MWVVNFLCDKTEIRPRCVSGDGMNTTKVISLVVFSIDDSACAASLAERKKAPREAGQGLLTVTAIFSHFDKTHTLANGYSER